MFIARVVFAWLFIILVYFFINHSLLSQLHNPALVYPGSDNTSWLVHLLSIPELLFRYKPLALGFDILLTCSCIVCIILPHQRIATWICVIGVWILYICYSSAAGKYYAQIGYLLAPLPFLALSPNRFDILWNLLRYWVCFLYVSAGLYKIYYGGFGDGGAMSELLWQTDADWFVFHHDGWLYRLREYMATHPSSAQWLYRVATLADLSLIIGFFTRRFDRWLLLALLCFHTANFILLGISFAEQSLIFAPFLPWHKWAAYYQSIKSDG